MGWIKNDNIQLDTFSEQDAVFFKNNDGLGFMLRGKIQRIENYDVTALIDAIYSLDGGSKVLSGEVYENYLNKEIKMHISFAHK